MAHDSRIVTPLGIQVTIRHAGRDVDGQIIVGDTIDELLVTYRAASRELHELAETWENRAGWPNG